MSAQAHRGNNATHRRQVEVRHPSDSGHKLDGQASSALRIALAVRSTHQETIGP